MENKGKKQTAKKSPQPLPTNEKTKDANNVFQVKDVNLTIPRGSLTAIVGPVGSGKSSLLQGLIGEMRRIEGSVSFGGSVAYCPQSAWIQVCPDT